VQVKVGCAELLARHFARIKRGLPLGTYISVDNDGALKVLEGAVGSSTNGLFEIAEDEC